MMSKWNRIGLIALLPLFFGCASQKVLADYKENIRQLHEERARLKKENRDLNSQLEGYEMQLADANAKLTAVPENPEYGDLDALGIDYGQRGRDFVISVPAEVTFASGRADLTKGGKSALSVVANTLKREYPGRVYWVEGHTDDDPIRKSKWASNRELSVARAMAVLHYLVEDCGIDDGECVVAGHGEYRPLGDNSSKSGKAKNRRVEIVVQGGS